MNVINKTIAEEVANKLVEKITNKISVQKELLSKKAIAFYLKTIPKKELDLIESIGKGWVNRETYLQFKSPAQYKALYINESVPKKQGNNYVLITETQMTIINNMSDNIEILKEKRKTLKL